MANEFAMDPAVSARRLAEIEPEVCNVLQLHDIESEDNYACGRTTARTA